MLWRFMALPVLMAPIGALVKWVRFAYVFFLDVVVSPGMVDAGVVMVFVGYCEFLFHRK